MVIVFDLDDTLYPEITFVYSGFRAVACYLSTQTGIDKDTIYHLLCTTLQSSGRGSVFDVVLKQLAIFFPTLVKQCLAIYRCHTPEIFLPELSIACLQRFKNFPLYIVTDGNKLVQHNKVQSLSVDQYVDFVFITHRYGVQNAKPSPYCFEKICKRERVSPQEVVYIGDNPYKDFVGIKPLGFKTVRVKQGAYQNSMVDHAHEAHYSVNDLTAITYDFLEKVMIGE